MKKNQKTGQKLHKQTKEERQLRKLKRGHISKTINQSTKTDSTDCNQVDEILRESKELYRFLFNNSNDALFVSLRNKCDNLPGRLILVNDIACQRLGYTREEFLQMTPLDISVSLPSIPETLEVLAREGQVIHEAIHIAKNGRKIPVEISTRAFELNGRHVNLSIARDVTERKQAEETLCLQSTALNAVANAIVITDREGTIQWVNPAWSTLTGYSSREAIGQNPRILKSDLQDDVYYRNLWDTILAGKVWRGELVNKRKDGSLYTKSKSLLPSATRAARSLTSSPSNKTSVSAREWRKG